MIYYINLLEFYHEFCSVIGLATHYLSQCALVNKMKAASWRFPSVREDDLDEVLKD